MSDFPQTSQVLDIFVPTFTELYDILSLYRKKAILSTGKQQLGRAFGEIFADNGKFRFTDRIVNVLSLCSLYTLLSTRA